eukprot:TRINITY_DN48484_c0_g1_i1.p1 TRINITY_DN48484_c0_g1~~TRINITY_DN48484_c0_g1_i1.p1  ORF type:complete len:1208 (-),score=221.77 TRINITY_DN48484_c0_g1_i1:104-3727(-)
MSFLSAAAVLRGAANAVGQPAALPIVVSQASANPSANRHVADKLASGGESVHASCGRRGGGNRESKAGAGKRNAQASTLDVFLKKTAKSAANASNLALDVGASSRSLAEIVGRSFHQNGNARLNALAAEASDAFRPSTTALADLRPFVSLAAVREPENPYDSNAVAICFQEPSESQDKVGHLPRALAAVLAPALDIGHVSVKVVEVDAADVLASTPGARLHAVVVLETRSSEGSEVAQACVRLGQQAGPTSKAQKRLRCSDATLQQQQQNHSSGGNAVPMRQKTMQLSLLQDWGSRGNAGGTCAGAKRRRSDVIDVEDLLGNSCAGCDGGRAPLQWHNLFCRLLPVIARELNVGQLAKIRQSSRELASVGATIVARQSCCIAVEQWLASVGQRTPPRHLLDGAAALPAENQSCDDGNGVACGTDCFEAVVAAWAPRPLATADVKEALMTSGRRAAVHTSDELPWFTVEEGWDGWRTLTIALLAAPGLRGKIQVCSSVIDLLDGLELVREFVALMLLLLPAGQPLLTPGLNGTVVNGTVATRRLGEDLLCCSRLLQEASVHIAVPGLRIPGFRLTEEQVAIVQRDLKPTDVLTVSAFAGTGKTATLRFYALLRPHLRILYICFNVTVRLAASKTFPGHVTCKSAHQLAFAAVGFKYSNKLSDDLRSEDIASMAMFDDNNFGFTHARPRTQHGGQRHDVAGETQPKLELAGWTIATLENFFHSSDFAVGLRHVPPQPLQAGSTPYLPEQLCFFAQQLWDKMRDMRNTDVNMTHNGYLKLYSLSRPSLAYDVVLLDEAQDCNPAIASIVLSQRCGRMLVGDGHQSIYGFLGATDALGEAQVSVRPGDTVCRRYLTQTFRFGPDVADAANFLLRTWKGERRPLLGRSRSECDKVHGPPPRGFLATLTPLCQNGNRASDSVVAAEGCPSLPFAFVARTNATVIQFGLLADEAGLRIFWVGGVKGYKLRLVRDLCLLASGERDKVESRKVRSFPSVQALRNFAERVGDKELLARAQLVNRYDASTLLRRVDALLATAEKHEQSSDAARQAAEQAAHVHLSTVHKAKGLEWNRLVVGEDFADMTEVEVNSGRDTQEINALYVAVTRAKAELWLPSNLWRLYGPEQDAPAVLTRVPPRDVGLPCPKCGDLVAGTGTKHGHMIVGSVSGRPLCSACAKASAFLIGLWSAVTTANLTGCGGAVKGLGVSRGTRQPSF